MASWIARSCAPGQPAVVYLFAYRLGYAPGADTTTPHGRRYWPCSERAGGGTTAAIKPDLSYPVFPGS
jgi:hypothetical protein